MFPFFGGYYYIIILILQVVFIIHALKSGRRDWLYILIFLPVVGSLVYFAMELLPEINKGEFTDNLVRIFLPNKKVKELERKLKIADTEANKMALAQEYRLRKNYKPAIDLVTSCIQGIYATDTGMMCELANLHYQNGDYTQSMQWFEKSGISKEAINIVKPEDEIFYARALQKAGKTQEAEQIFQQAIRVHHSMEARYYYGLLLKEQNRNSEAQQQFQTNIDERSLHPKYVRRLNRPWIQLSKKELRSLK